MVIELFDIGTSSKKFDFSLAPEKIDLEQENARLVEGVQTQGIITKGIAQVDVEGEIQTKASVECARCLQPIVKDLKIPFRAVFIAPEDLTQEKEAELNLSELDVSALENESIDLEELVREQIILNLSDQSFCREDCRGLCDSCGANRNVTDCHCREKEIDPRWSGLLELKNKN